MKKEWQKPVLEVLDVKETMSPNGHGIGKGQGNAYGLDNGNGNGYAYGINGLGS